MANKSAILSVKIVTDAKDGQKGLDNYASRLDKFSAGAKKLAAPAGLVFAGVGAAALAAGKLAAEAEQNVGAVETVFGKAGKSVLGWSKQSADAVGMSASSYNGLAASIGGSLASAGLSQDAMAAKTNDLISASADLSSVFGGDAAEAAAAMGAGLRGEFDSLERFGIFMNMNAVNAKLAATGQDKLTGAALDAAKKQTITNMMLEQAGKYSGNFAREADTAAGAQQRATAKFEDAATQLGEQLLPVMTKAAELGAGMATWIGQNIPLVSAIAIAIAGLAAAVLIVNGALMVATAAAGVWKGITATATAAQWLWNAAMSANPIGIVVLAIVALVAAVVLAYNNVGWFRDGVDAAMAAITGFVQAAAAWLVAAWSTAVAAVQAAVQAVVTWFQDAWRNAVAVVRAIVSVVGGFFAAYFAAVRAVVQAVVSWFTSAWSGAVATVRGIVSGIGGFFSSAFSTARGAVQPIIDLVRGTLAGAFETVRSIGTGAFDAIGRAIQGVIGWARDAIGWVRDLFGAQNSAKANQPASGSWYMRPAIDVPEDGRPFYLTAAEPALASPARWATAAPSIHNEINVRVEVGPFADPVEVGRQIDKALRKYRTTMGVAV